ncbi:MAG: hypothetical protein EXR75_08700 [Myxococcales bacterium]|nr:hypothetical protein [Myxococcales bacterium]
MTKLIATIGLLGLLGGMSGCAYAGIAASGDKVVVLRNDMFLLGLLRKATVCKVTDSGLESCSSQDTP